MLDEFAAENVHPDQWNVKGLDDKLIGQFGLSLDARRASSRVNWRGTSWARRSSKS
jgi:hypothetical protein